MTPDEVGPSRTRQSAASWHQPALPQAPLGCQPGPRPHPGHSCCTAWPTRIHRGRRVSAVPGHHLGWLLRQLLLVRWLDLLWGGAAGRWVTCRFSCAVRRPFSFLVSALALTYLYCLYYPLIKTGLEKIGLKSIGQVFRKIALSKMVWSQYGGNRECKWMKFARL